MTLHIHHNHIPGTGDMYPEDPAYDKESATLREIISQDAKMQDPIWVSEGFCAMSDGDFSSVCQAVASGDPMKTWEAIQIGIKNALGIPEF